MSQLDRFSRSENGFPTTRPTTKTTRPWVKVVLMRNVIEYDSLHIRYRLCAPFESRPADFATSPSSPQLAL